MMFGGQYFSSLERLRLAQSSSMRPKSSSGRSNYTSLKTTSYGPTRHRSTLLRRNSSYFKSSSILRSRKPASPTSDTFSPSDAQWFLRLPDKVQQKHFTPEERLLLSGRSEAFIPDAADERVLRSFYHQGREVNRSVPTLSISSSASVSSKNTYDLELPFDSAEDDMDDSAFDGFRWIENDDDHDLASTLHLDDYHEFMNQAADPNPNPKKRQPSFRRTLSLTALPFGSSTWKPAESPTTTPLLPTSSLSTAPAEKSELVQKPSKSQLKEKAHNKHSSVSTINHDPPALHYMDPTARMKLRVYLASPQKFDEAVEFGFPSMNDQESVAPSRPSLTRNPNTAPCKTTFLHDDNPSIYDALDDNSSTMGSDPGADYDDAEDYALSLPSRSSPNTPLDPEFSSTDGLGPSHTGTYLLSPSEKTSFAFGGNSQRNSQNPSSKENSHSTSNASSTLFFPRPTVRHNYEYDDPYVQALSGGREMTLRMTLTRPDLRADEREIFPNSCGQSHLSSDSHPGMATDDPLALEHLPLTEADGNAGGNVGCGAADIWDTLPLPKERGVLKRVWRKVSGRNN